MQAAERFDADYYRRFYGDPRTRVGSDATTARLAAFVVAYLRHLGIDVRSVLDLGCGVGRWRTALRRLLPRAAYTGVERSEHLCRELGWTRGSAVDFAPGKRFDLVVCQGVLQYLSDRDAAKALRNLAALAKGALYLEALTALDWRENCDRSVTDGDVFLRSGAWYRRRLRPAFVDQGGGVFVARSAGVVTFELENLDAARRT